MATVRIKDPWREKRLFETRALFAGAFIVVLTLALLSRLYLLQIVRHDYYSELAQGNRVRIEPIPAARGVIMDRNGLVIATSQPAYQLELKAEDTPNVKETLTALAQLGLVRTDEIDELQRLIRAHRRFESVPLRLRMSEEDVARFAVHRWEFRGVDISTRQTRSYPNGPLAVHALGYVSSISESDMNQQGFDRAAYVGTSVIGKLGVEAALEKVLHGKNGSREVMVNAQGRSVTMERKDKLFGPDFKVNPPLPAVAGDDVYLSLDLKVQQVAEEALAGKEGAVVALDPNNGDVLALVSMPGFDPNLFARGITGKEYKALRDDPDVPLLNRAIRSAYPPGSTVKPMLALGAITAGTLDPDRKFTCTGQFHVPGSSRIMHEFHNEKHGTLDMDSAIVRSCDSYFYTVAQNMGVDKMAAFMGPFGYGSLTGIDIGGEKPGILPSREWKAHYFKKPADQIWFPGETVNMGVGQGYLTVTPIQQAHYVSIMASRGKIFRPRLVRATKDAKGVLHEFKPIYEGEIKGVTPEHWERVRNDMVGVVQRGTAYAPFIKAAYQAAGKTGTAQVYTVQQDKKYEGGTNEALRDHSWFIAYAPAEAPRIAVAVIVEHGGSGASAAAPIARKVLDAYLVGPDGKLKPAPEDPAAASTGPAAPVQTPAPAPAAPAPAAAPTEALAAQQRG